MARQNDVSNYGFAAERPEISKDTEGNYIRGIFHLTVIRSSRYDGGSRQNKDIIMYDHPIVLSTDPDIIKQMEKVRQYDIIELIGMFNARKIHKNKICTECGAVNKIESNIYFITPSVLKVRKTGLTSNQATEELIENREFSNKIIIIGNLCNDVNYFHKDGIQTSVYQIATNRKYILKADNPDNKSDFLIVRTFGHNAKQDSICIHTGTLINIDGYLHSRTFKRQITCNKCNETFEADDTIIEIVPYTSDYLTNFTDPKIAQEQQRLAEIEEGNAAMKNLLS